MKVLDRYAHKVPIKGGYANMVTKKFIITSNSNPNEWYDNDKNSMGALYRRITRFGRKDTQEGEIVWKDGPFAVMEDFFF